MPLLILDVGSSSVRALVLDDTLNTITSAQHSYQFTSEPAGASQIDADRLLTLIDTCIDQVLVNAPSINAVGMATFVGNLAGVDTAGRPVTALYTYADVRSTADVLTMRLDLDTEVIHQRTGCPLHTAYHPARLHWLRRVGHVPVARWLDLATLCYERWFGHPVPCSYSIASWSGLLNRELLTWDTPLLTYLNIEPERLPTLADYDTPQQGLTQHYAERWPVLQQVPFFLAVGDGAAANLGSGAVDQHHLALTIGTTAALRRISDDRLPPVPAGLWAYRVSARQHLLGGATSEGGNIYQWLSSHFTLPPDTDDLLLRRPLSEHGLTFLPLLAGERSPGWNSSAVGTLHGLRLTTTPLDILQAGFEGVALRLSLITDRLVTPDEPVRIYAGGRALVQSRAWTRICAAALNRPLTVLDEPETTVRGVAVLVQRALGLPEPPPPSIRALVEPDAGDAERLAAARSRQSYLYDLLYGDVPDVYAV